MKEKHHLANQIRSECDNDLSSAKIKIDKAQDSLALINESDLQSIKIMSSPSITLKMLFEVICILLDEQPLSIPNPSNPKIKSLSYWETTKHLLTKPKLFKDKLINLDKDNIQEELIDKIRANYINNKDFTFKKVELNASNAIGNLYYYYINI